MDIIKRETRQHRGIYEEVKEENPESNDNSKKNKRKKKECIRTGDKTYIYSAYLLDTTTEYKSIDFKSQEEKEIPSNFTGVDMIEFTVTLDWVYDFHGLMNKLHNSNLLTLKCNGQYVHIRIHGDFITHKTNLYDFIVEKIHKLALCDFFQVPITRIDFDNSTGEVLEEKAFNVEEPTSYEEFLKIILNHLTLQRVEIFHDSTEHLPDKFREGDFKIVKGTLYSGEYKVYDDGRKIKSMLSNYDKANQKEDVKKVYEDDIRWRFEIRLLKSTGVLKKAEDWKLLLYGTMDDIFPRFWKRIRHYKNNRIPNRICLSAFILSLSPDDVLLKVLQEEQGCLHSWIKNKDKFIEERLAPIEPYEEQDEPIPYDFDELDWRLSVS